ncbi:MAG: UDP-N-acetylglucosamine 2-epimerase (non-hydrolyzing) [Pyrinomonadaceae bacterium]|nr:UDP-N-acetylglucosamine 2-epimerase (non-hydrolyzing) [Pyrinomonadaceae bacterium]
MLKVLNIVGARPNFMKVAPIIAEMKRRNDEFSPLLVHTGQHYDAKMSDAFFEDLGMPAPDVYLGVGSGSHAAQTAKVMIEFEPILLEHKPDWVLVVGDVNSTLACALVCAKLGVKVAHVEAGLRSRDRAMPEEINRILTDQISDLLLTPSPDAEINLLQENIAPERIKFVGNVMIDSLFENLKRAATSQIREHLSLHEKGYAVLTLHRPSNVDDKTIFSNLLNALEKISESLPVVFPVHPRTRAKIGEFGFTTRIESNSNLRLVEPLGYLDFLRLYSGAKLVLTDSGGLQEETTALKIPCLTLRENTERPVTVEMGTNKIVGTNTKTIINAANDVLNGSGSNETVSVPQYWDGKTAGRICDVISQTK